MGEVVALRPLDPAEQRWRDEVTLVCDLAGFPELAAAHLARGTTRARFYFDLMARRPDIRSAETSAIYLARLCGRAGTARHALPLHPQPHGTRPRLTREN